MFCCYKTILYICISKKFKVVNRMKERIIKIMEMEQMSYTQFSEIIGVQRSSISHMTKGRNNPSLDLVMKILKAFPKINSDWLLFGTGSMYKDNTTSNSVSNVPDTTIDTPTSVSTTVTQPEEPAVSSTPLFTNPKPAKPKVVKQETTTPTPTSTVETPLTQESQTTVYNTDTKKSQTDNSLQMMLENGLFVLDPNSKTLVRYQIKM